MLIFATLSILLLTALALVLLRSLRPGFKYPWLVAVSGSSLALMSVFFWQLRFPDTIVLIPWQAGSGALFFPTWLADGRSWPYALALQALTAAVIWTSIVRNENEPMIWAGTLVLSAVGVSAVAAGNPVTMILAWAAIDLVELGIMLRAVDGEDALQGAVLAFVLRLIGILLVLWALLDAASLGLAVNFEAIPGRTAVLLILAAGFRLGVFPLHALFGTDSVLRRGFATILRMVSAVTGLVLLARLPSELPSGLLTFLLTLLAAAAAVYAGWIWLRSSDEVIGRRFFILGMTSLSTAAVLLGNPSASLGWGVALLLTGGALFLYSARQPGYFWFLLFSLWPALTLPFSPTAAAWSLAGAGSWFFLIPLALAQALLIAGCVRHMRHPGETSLESHERWARVIYPIGLGLPILAGILLGLWGWEGARNPGTWWLGILQVLLAAGVILFVDRFLVRIKLASPLRWAGTVRLGWFPAAVIRLYRTTGRLAEGITSTLEGDGGLLWSFLLLVLILSLLAGGAWLP
jgi:hypothetical protein